MLTVCNRAKSMSFLVRITTRLQQFAFIESQQPVSKTVLWNACNVPCLCSLGLFADECCAVIANSLSPVPLISQSNQNSGFKLGSSWLWNSILNWNYANIGLKLDSCNAFKFQLKTWVWGQSFNNRQSVSQSLAKTQRLLEWHTDLTHEVDVAGWLTAGEWPRTHIEVERFHIVPSHTDRHTIIVHYINLHTHSRAYTQHNCACN